jgi:hypothetical protein
MTALGCKLVMLATERGGERRGGRCRHLPTLQEFQVLFTTSRSGGFGCSQSRLGTHDLLVTKIIFDLYKIFRSLPQDYVQPVRPIGLYLER